MISLGYVHYVSYFCSPACLLTFATFYPLVIYSHVASLRCVTTFLAAFRVLLRFVPLVHGSLRFHAFLHRHSFTFLRAATLFLEVYTWSSSLLPPRLTHFISGTSYAFRALQILHSARGTIRFIFNFAHFASPLFLSIWDTLIYAECFYASRSFDAIR